VSAISALIIRYTDDAQPGWCECQFTDAWGHEWTFVDKVPIFTSSLLDATSSYPQPGIIACQIVKKWQDVDGREIVTVDTTAPDAIEATTGEFCFDVLPTQIIES
jgi:hypothetical protein